MHVCVVTACAHVLWPRPDIYCNYYVRAKFKPGGAPGCYDARGNTGHNLQCIGYLVTQYEVPTLYSFYRSYMYTVPSVYG